MRVHTTATRIGGKACHQFDGRVEQAECIARRLAAHAHERNDSAFVDDLQCDQHQHDRASTIRRVEAGQRDGPTHLDVQHSCNEIASAIRPALVSAALQTARSGTRWRRARRHGYSSEARPFVPKPHPLVPTPTRGPGDPGPRGRKTRSRTPWLYLIQTSA